MEANQVREGMPATMNAAELGNGRQEEQSAVQYMGRKVTAMTVPPALREKIGLPASHEGEREGGGLCCALLCLVTLGCGIAWGVLESQCERGSDGCKEDAVEGTKIGTIVGVSLIGAYICCIATLICCAGGAVACTKD